MRSLYLNYFWLVTILRSLRQSRAALEAETAGGLLDGDLHAGQAPALDPLSVLVIAVLQRHRLLGVGTLKLIIRSGEESSDSTGESSNYG